MGILIGFVGKPSSGKTTLLNALALTDAKMGDYPFTTIDPNKGVGFVQVKCPCKAFKTKCNPRVGVCNDGLRSVPIELLDVAGLVPGASSGKGMGNKFLDDLRQADAFIHVVDASGRTDAEGNPTENWDPVKDIKWLEDELTTWINSIIFSDWKKFSRKIEIDKTKLDDHLAEKLGGLGATVSIIKKSRNKLDFTTQKTPSQWNEEEKLLLSKNIRENLFPMVIAANKFDKATSETNIEKMRKTYPEKKIIPTSGLAELVLRKADEAGLIKYIPGRLSIEYQVDKSDKRVKIVRSIEENLFSKGKTTGVNELIETIVFQVLDLIPVFPVNDSTHLTDKDGKVLPDCFLVKKGTTAIQFAGMIHSDFAKSFINAIHVNSGKRIGASYELQEGDILKINSASNR